MCYDFINTEPENVGMNAKVTEVHQQWCQLIEFIYGFIIHTFTISKTLPSVSILQAT